MTSKGSDQPRNEAAPEAPDQTGRLGRRGFLKATGALLIGAGLEAACRPEPAANQAAAPAVAPQPPVPATTRFPNRVLGQYDAVPDTPEEPPTLGILYFFTLHEAQTVEALTARIMPGSPDDPGAREAGVVHYIDFLLSHQHGFAQPIYRNPPFAEPYSGDSPPQEREAEGGYQVLWVPADQLPRYGYQSSLTPREIYRRGLVAVDEYATRRFGASFTELSEDRQDAVVEAMAAGMVTPPAGRQQDGQASGNQETGYYPPSLEDFFEVLRNHTVEGMFADPLYGGNRDLVGWKLLGYPGAQRAYTATEVRTEGTARQPQSIADLPHFHPGRPANDEVLLPVSGSDQKRSR